MNYVKGKMKNFNFSKAELDITSWLADKQAINDELSAIRSAQAKAKKELKKEAEKWSFNYKLA